MCMRKVPVATCTPFTLLLDTTLRNAVKFGVVRSQRQLVRADSFRSELRPP